MRGIGASGHRLAVGGTDPPAASDAPGDDVAADHRVVPPGDQSWISISVIPSSISSSNSMTWPAVG